MPTLNLSLLTQKFSICRFPATAAIPAWALQPQDFISITRTTDELSIVCEQSLAPRDAQQVNGWRAFKVAGPLDFSLTGILFKLLAPLAENQISIFALSTYDTDYILVKEENLDAAIAALEKVCKVQV